MSLKATLEQWRMFKAVVDHGGFNQAALAVHKSQSSIHHAVHKLEDALGLALLQVEGRRVILTDAGELMLRRARYLLEEAAALESIAHTLSRGVESRLDLAVDEAFPQTELYRTLESVSTQFPNLRIELRETILNGANEWVSEGGAQLGLSPFPLADGVNEQIAQVRFVPVASPTHPLIAQHHTLEIDDLKQYRQIVVRDSALHRHSDAGWLGADQRWTVSHVRSSIDLVQRGLGFAWLPQPEIAPLLQRGALVRLPLPPTLDRSATFYLTYRDVDQLGPAARALIGELRYQTLHLPLGEESGF